MRIRKGTGKTEIRRILRSPTQSRNWFPGIWGRQLFGKRDICACYGPHGDGDYIRGTKVTDTDPLPKRRLVSMVWVDQDDGWRVTYTISIVSVGLSFYRLSCREQISSDKRTSEPPGEPPSKQKRVQECVGREFLLALLSNPTAMNEDRTPCTDPAYDRYVETPRQKKKDFDRNHK